MSATIPGGYGCIAKTLKHSYSAEIHRAICGDDYTLAELAPEEIAAFLENREFRGINVTIPYKETVIPFLDGIDEEAKAIGAVNTIVCRDGSLRGYNTDVFGMKALFAHADISPEGRKVAILGSGGTAKTAKKVVTDLGAAEILTVSRHAGEGLITYDELYNGHADVEIVVNTTPVGMYPNIFDNPIDLSRLPAVVGVIDAIYNPLRTPLVLAARERKIKAEGGLYMLVAQAVRASELFHSTTYPNGTTDRVYAEILRQKENVVLIGMPSCGKTTVGKILARAMGRTVIDCDKQYTEDHGMRPDEAIRTLGEPEFREHESETIARLATRTGTVIATGGGAILRRENIRALKENGRLYFIDRPLRALMPTANRPLSSNPEAVRKRYRERYGLYLYAMDRRVFAGSGLRRTVEKIRNDFENYSFHL